MQVDDGGFKIYVQGLSKRSATELLHFLFMMETDAEILVTLRHAYNYAWRMNKKDCQLG